jgi:hypothetical protein
MKTIQMVSPEGSAIVSVSSTQRMELLLRNGYKVYEPKKAAPKTKKGK